MIRFHIWDRVHCVWRWVTAPLSVWRSIPRAVGVLACVGGLSGLPWLLRPPPAPTVPPVYAKPPVMPDILAPDVLFALPPPGVPFLPGEYLNAPHDIERVAAAGIAAPGAGAWLPALLVFLVARRHPGRSVVLGVRG